MREDLDNHRRLFDGGDDLEFATAHAALKINVEPEVVIDKGQLVATIV